MIPKKKVKVRIKTYNELGSKDTLLKDIGLDPIQFPYIGKIVFGIEMDSAELNANYLYIQDLPSGSYSFLSNEYEVLEYLEDENLDTIG